MKIGIREAKAHLSHYLKEVQQGHSVTITDHGRAIAVLSPLGISSRAFSRLKNLLKRGVLLRLGGKPKGLKRPPHVRKPNALSSAILEGRE